MRLIDADEIILQFGISDGDIIAKETINDAPTIDAVPVVRCRDCKHSKEPAKLTQLYGEPGTMTCTHGPCNRRNVNENDFCSYGEKKMNDKSYIATYDTQEQIDKCLSCKKPDCTNCMEYKVNMKDPCLDCLSKPICRSGSCKLKTSYRMAFQNG